MSGRLGWGLAALAIAAGWLGWGWPGVALGVTVVVFWLLLQWSRAIRVMRAAGERPVGVVPSAVMLHARLSAGLTMLQVLPLTRSLGQPISETPERWAWHDAAGNRVETDWHNGRLERWHLVRPPDAPDPPADPDGAGPHPAGPEVSPTSGTPAPAPSAPGASPPA